MHAWLYTYVYLSSEKINGWPQELKKFRRVPLSEVHDYISIPVQKV